MRDRALQLETQAGKLRDHEKLTEIVLTGGPCAGKTTAVSLLANALADYGYKTLVCPEVSTLMVNAGVDVHTLDSSGEHDFELQRQIIRTQRVFRKRFREFATLYTEPVVVLFDRGEIDNAAYVSSEVFERLCEEEGLSLDEVRDSYDLVIHLVSAADGAEDAYSTSNNDARTETIEQALVLDRKTLAAWDGHPRRCIIDNSTDFATKMSRVLEEVTHLLAPRT